MINFKYLSIVLAIVSVCANSQSGEREQKEMEMCAVAAKNLWEHFDVDKSVLNRECDCVRTRRNGELPRKASDWKKRGNSSAMHTLVECAQSDIISFHSGTELEWEMKRLERQGLINDASAVQKAENFSACVGEISYNEVLRVTAIADRQAARLDKAKYLKMYRLCEAESSTSN
jgi:hypothetical protein